MSNLLEIVFKLPLHERIADGTTLQTGAYMGFQFSTASKRSIGPLLSPLYDKRISRESTHRLLQQLRALLVSC